MHEEAAVERQQVDEKQEVSDSSVSKEFQDINERRKLVGS